MKYLPVTAEHTIPALGLGTWKSNKGEVGAAVAKAIEIGYRHIDCAPIYMNEQEVGEALHGVLVSGQVKREELWITSKLWNNAHAKKHVRPALEKTLKDLRLEYLDLFLIHWPVHFQPNVLFPRKPEEFLAPEAIPLSETWQAMEALVDKGLCRFIGVCNFHLGRLQALKEQARIQPLMNQIELHPYLQQVAMLEYCRANNTLLTGYSPLGSGDRPAAMKQADEPSLLSHPLIMEIAGRHGFTPGQVLLAWALARGTVVIPKSVNPGRLQENLAAADLVLNATDIETINTLEAGYRYVAGSFFTTPGSPYTLTELWG
ncbi:MAG: aldo/keto reductase [Desulforhopalus sp.]|nr:aldo/keto reductase [Desulforhopalus sp.]